MGDELELKLNKPESPDWKFFISFFGFMLIMIAGMFIYVNHIVSLQCSDHASNGFTTKLGGDIINRVCYIKENSTGRFIPLDTIGSTAKMDNYAKLA